MSNPSSFRTGQQVRWNWGNGNGGGKVAERHERPVTRTLTGSAITRNGSADDPAYLIRLDDGAEVLKLGSEFESAR